MKELVARENLEYLKEQVVMLIDIMVDSEAEISGELKDVLAIAHQLYFLKDIVNWKQGDEK